MWPECVMNVLGGGSDAVARILTPKNDAAEGVLPEKFKQS